MNPDEGARHDIDATAVLINEAAGSFVSGKRRISWLELHCLGDRPKTDTGIHQDFTADRANLRDLCGRNACRNDRRERRGKGD